MATTDKIIKLDGDEYFIDNDGMPLFTIKQVAQITGASLQSARNWLKIKDLENYGRLDRFGNMMNPGWVFRADQILQWLGDRKDLKIGWHDALKEVATQLISMNGKR